MAQLDLSNVVVVSVQTAPAGVADFNVANLCLLTDEQPNDSAVLTDGLLYYRSFTQLAADWPTTSRVYEAGSLYFSQSANGLLAGGMLIVAPNQSDAVEVTLNTDYTDTGTWTIYGTNSKTHNPTVIKDEVGNSFYLKGNDVTISSEQSQALTLIAIGEYKEPDAEDGDQTLTDDQNVVLGTYDPTANGEGIRLPVDHFNTVCANVFFGCSVYLTADDYSDYFNLQLASASAAVHRIYGGFTSNTNDLRAPSGSDAGGWVYQAKSNGRFFKAVYDSRNPYAIIATAFGYIQSTVFTGSDTAMTLFAKELTGITADPTMTEALKLTCTNAGVDFVGLIGGKNWFWSSPTYLDEMYGLLYTEYAMLVAYTNVIRTTFTKIPQTEKGMLIIKNALAQICDQLVTCGLLAPGKWNNPSKFGDIDDFDEQISLVGYYIYSEPISSQTQNQREERQAPLIQIAAKGAGAIQGGSLIFQFEA